MDRKSEKELLDFIVYSIDLIKKRTENIHASSDFLDDDAGLEKLDAVSMRLQSIGEALKSLMKRDESLLLKAASKEYWRQIIRMREIISHHYIDLDAEIVFDICHNELDELREYIERLR